MKINFKHKGTYIPFFVLSIICFIVSCASHNNKTAQQTSIKSEPKIIFLNYNIKKNASGVKSIQFIDKKITDGKLKSINPHEPGAEGDLILSQLDKQSNVLEHTVIKNPLYKSIEYLNQSNSFERKEINLDSIRFTVRLQLKPETKYISINNFNTIENKNKSLIKTEIY